MKQPASCHRAQSRLYILIQVAGWGFLLAIQLAAFLEQQSPTLPVGAYPKVHPVEFALARFVVPTAIGFILTHYLRYFITEWGWKRLNWKALMPRIVGTSLILALLLIASSMGISSFLLSHADTRIKSASIFILVWVGNSFLFAGWLIAYFFYHLFERFSRTENERLNLVASKRGAELRALKSQVNPHFIFNSLNSLRSLIDEDPARARLAVTQLANLLRYSLRCGQFETVPLHEDLRMANDYLALEQVRFEERLILRIDVSIEALPLHVPSMLLQTLAENAIKYGIAQRREGGEISIIAYCDEEMLHLQVTNPTGPYSGPDLSSESTGLGLRNAAHRLQLLFGMHATLQLRPELPDLIVAEVLIPLKSMTARQP